MAEQGRLGSQCLGRVLRTGALFLAGEKPCRSEGLRSPFGALVWRSVTFVHLFLPWRSLNFFYRPLVKILGVPWAGTSSTRIVIGHVSVGRPCSVAFQIGGPWRKLHLSSVLKVPE